MQNQVRLLRYTPHMPSYTLRQLEYLVAVAEYGSVSGAALALHVSQSTLSSGISEIEKALSLQLLVRHHAKGVSLTHAGERLLVKARAMLDDAELLEQDARDLGSSPVGAISVGVYSVIAPYLVPELLFALARDFPDLEVRIEEVSLPELNDGLISGRFEIGLGYDFGRASAVRVQRLFDVSAHVVVPTQHRLAHRTSIRLHDIADEPIVLLDLPHSRDYFERVFHEAGIKPHIRYRTGSTELARALVARGMGVALLNMRPAHNTTVDGHTFVMLDIKDDIPPAHVVAMTLDSARPTRRTQAVLDTAIGLTSRS